MTACRYARTCQWRLKRGDSPAGCTVLSQRNCDAAKLNAFRYPLEHVARHSRSKPE